MITTVEKDTALTEPVFDRLGGAPEIWAAAAAALRPIEDMKPSEFAERFRILAEGTTERPGPWRNSHFPILVELMDAIKEAIDKGYDGVVIMKPQQGGGSEAMINCVAWLLTYYPGPLLYLISTDAIAKEFSRDRFEPLFETCEPIAKKRLTGKKAGTMQVRRLVDGKLATYGGQSITKMESLPYRWVFVDEPDSLKQEIKDRGDPIEMARGRTDAYRGPTLIIAFSHPSIRTHGSGKLYYQESDQRRAHAECVHCGHWFWFDRQVVLKATARDDMTQEQADLDPSCYAMYCPDCGCEISDTERWRMIKNTKQISTLKPEVAATKRWIGMHFNQLYYPGLTLQEFVARYLKSKDDPARMRVFVNRTEGDVYEVAVKETRPDQWRSLIVVPASEDDPADYTRGTVPDGVQYLTAGQDSNKRFLHWAVWGWGLVRDVQDRLYPCGWLIDYDVIERDPPSDTLELADLKVFDQLLYSRLFPSVDGDKSYQVLQCYHDAGWQPIGPMQYAEHWIARAIPAKGAAEDSASRAPVHRWGAAIRWMLPNGEMYSNPAIRLALMNTYLAKLQWFGLVDKYVNVSAGEGREPIKKMRLVLPRSVNDEFIKQSASEHLVTEKGKQIWKARGPNHFSDCNVYAYICAEQNSLFAPHLPFDELVAKQADQGYKPRDEGPEGEGRPSGWKIGR